MPNSPRHQVAPKFRCTHCDQILSIPLPHMIEYSRYCDNYNKDDYVLIPQIEDQQVKEIEVIISATNS